MSILDVVGTIHGPIDATPWEPVELAAPAPPDAPPAPQQGPPADDHPVVDAAAVATLAAVLLAGGADLALAVAGRLLTAGFTGPVAAGIAEFVTASTPVPSSAVGVLARRRIALRNAVLRARYVLNAAQRVTDAVVSGTPLEEALQAERTHWQAHRSATAHRAAAARQVDQAAAVSPLLRWRTVHDDRVTPDCAALDGRVFDVARPPGGTYPGTVHARCRCTATPIRNTTQLSKESTMDTRMIDPATGHVIELSGPVSTVAPSDRTSPREVVPHVQTDDDRYGPEALPPSPDTLDMIKHLRENNPYMFSSASDIASTIEAVERRRPRVGQGFDAAGQRGWHDQMPVGECETHDRLFTRPGETDAERRIRVAEQDALEPRQWASRADAADYARQFGLV
ncbi:minor capsid protein [Pseudonocardia sp. 73-21]|uniref:minor capsid protein n=1 Tax=Pseudonocardia sp. 73-21 TaxID=1895809 RepID=UPI000962CDB5|nr:minor capsid protein [Pseudonocardia sp. 73-21]OJY40312.1 MAG: hypothetical protein BGP03_00405 [Pseudonocardia sp. 73-21]